MAEPLNQLNHVAVCLKVLIYLTNAGRSSCSSSSNIVAEDHSADCLFLIVTDVM